MRKFLYTFINILLIFFFLDRAVGFFAKLTKSIPHLGDYQPIQFDNVVTNIGQAYDPLHGHFTAPVTGLYLISASIMSVAGKTINCEIVKNNLIVTAMYGGNADYQGDTQTIVLDLKTGDQIYVRHVYGDGYANQQVNVYNSYMAGFLIQQHV